MPRPIPLALALLVTAGCRPPTGANPTPGAVAAAESRDALAVSDDLEALIDRGAATEDDRTRALDEIRAIPDDESAGYAFARAAVTGRVAELRGVKAGRLVGEAESFAQTSIERDPEFRGRAASRLLGSLWVQAPPRLVEHGDSEEGLSLLEALAEQQPDEVLNHLRLAEAYLFLGDPEPAVPHLCVARASRQDLRRTDDSLLTRLLEEAAEEEGELSCDAAP